ncbi:molybdopterin-containing oxidoreductase family protein [Streptomyces aidingensis]|uniref:Anaerobic selenocysteine-containing dehydrogenase n=1 Tax=Streptomyces aidingensis TaxID=910347 RepID=A0A1I1N5B7_9ACTN|nr:molybdopterin-dependent oxidoreductase [Streptomyces aidingensis]SFC92884.1 Anaerobic selenocysteine-containing dehydrogenase [Streptomyces aidingensis]
MSTRADTPSTGEPSDVPPGASWELGRRDLLRIGAAAGAAVAGLGILDAVHDPGPVPASDRGTGPAAARTAVPSMCQMCTTACGIIGHVVDGRLVEVTGNPLDPNSRGSVCAKGVAGPSVLYDPHRLLYPLRRTGPRGSGRWKRISWEEAYTEIAGRLREIRERGAPEEFAFQQGRNRSGDIVSRFLNAYGTPSHFNHRALCSNNRRAAIVTTIGDSDWDLGDFENSRYVLNFGSNWAEAHQGHIPVAIRMMEARRRGARLVTFETRLSNTAALSDEWFCVKPGTDGLIALAMANVICREELWDREWLDTWSNYPAEDFAAHVARYTPEYAEEHSGVPAADIARIAREFAAAAPRATTICNRGSQAHRNGFYNDRAITVLNALVGSMGKKGGWCWHPNGSWDKKAIPEPGPIPPRPTASSVIADARDWPLANAFEGKRMRVGEIVYLWIKEGRQKISALMTYNADTAWAWPEANLVRSVLADESLIPFHVCIDVMYSETAHLADIVLPWTTYLERWDIDARPPQSLVDYVGLRQPVVAPRGESKDIRDIFPELARRIGGGMETYFPWATTEEYLEAFFAPVPGGLAAMRRDGIHLDPEKQPNYEPYMRRLTPGELAGATEDPATGIITSGTDDKGRPRAIGIRVKGIARRGFSTPSRKVEIHCGFIVGKGREAGRDIEPLPVYEPIADHQGEFPDDQFIMTSFKINVHNAHRTMQSKWLQEISHTNPALLNRASARRLGIADGDWIVVESYRPNDPDIPQGDGSPLGTLRTRVRLTEGVHPLVIAIAHNSGRSAGGAYATNGRDRTANPGYGTDAADPDLDRLWWSGALSVPQNDLLPIYPDPRTGGQAYHDTIVRIRKA